MNKSTLEITGIVRRGHGTIESPFVQLDLGKQPSNKEIDAHIERFGIDQGLPPMAGKQYGKV